jgi:NAD(P)-dependent dehydrogenase (short-subunit alcohol dehydrogenase family)
MSSWRRCPPRWASPPAGSPNREETAALITFLASPQAGNLTGADYLADGGVIKTV